jgi:hypothetical protein
MSERVRCHCESCDPENPWPTYTRAYRLECEAKGILKLPFEERGPRLERIEKARGKAAADELKAEMIRIHRGGKSLEDAR